MIPKISACAVASLILSQSLLAEAATPGVQDQPVSPAAKPARVAPKVQEAPAMKVPTARVPARLRERPGFKMTCPDANEVTLHLSYVGGWSLDPTQLQPATFTRAYG